MSRTPNKKMPSIAVEEAAVRTRVDLPTALNEELERFAHYYAEKIGRKPLTMSHVIIGLLETYVVEHGDFQKWKKDAAQGATDGSPFAQPIAMRAASVQT